jgi:hypothetical protein
MSEHEEPEGYDGEVTVSVDGGPARRVTGVDRPPSPVELLDSAAEA